MRHNADSSRAALACLFAVSLLTFPHIGLAQTTMPADSPALGHFPFLTVDAIHKQVRVECEALHCEAPLEFFCCVADTHDYESVLRSRVRPSHLHAALLMQGLKPGEPVHFDDVKQKWIAPHGPRLNIKVEFQSNGKTVTIPAYRLMRDIKTKKTMPPMTWIFAGSRLMPAPGGGEVYAADPTGYLVSVVNFELTVIDIPDLASSANETLEWQTNPDTMPPKGTKVTLIIEPAGHHPTSGPAARAAVDPPAGASTSTTHSTLYLIGDSTVKNGTPGLVGWGEVISHYVDLNRIAIENDAIGGRSSRTFYTEGRWDRVMGKLKPGDFVMMQFGHNDGANPKDPRGKGRGSIRGTGDETVQAPNAKGRMETVHSYGWYMRQYVDGAKSRGAVPIVLSPIPRNDWKEGKVLRNNNSYGKWARQTAETGDAAFIDLNEICARRYEQLGQAAVKTMFPREHTHTNAAGADLNAQCVIAGIRGLKDCPLAGYLSAKGNAIEASDAVVNPPATATAP